MATDNSQFHNIKLERYFTLLAALILLSACTITREVRPVQSKIPQGATICIEENPRVIEPKILGVIERSLFRNGFIAEIHSKNPEYCKFRITYTAFQKWDVSTFLSEATIRLYESTKLIGSAEYRIPAGIFGGGGANPKKWASTESKIAPLLDELLGNPSRDN